MESIGSILSSVTSPDTTTEEKTGKKGENEKSTPIPIAIDVSSVYDPSIPPYWVNRLKQPYYLDHVEDIEKYQPLLPHGKSLYIWGPPGTGKTHLATLLYVKRSAQLPYYSTSLYARPFLWVAWSQLALEVRDFENQSINDAIKIYLQIPLLLIDDLFSGWRNDYDLRVCQHILEMRLLRCRETIITSNLKPSEINDLDKKIFERLLEGRILHLGGESYRLRRWKQENP